MLQILSNIYLFEYELNKKNLEIYTACSNSLITATKLQLQTMLKYTFFFLLEPSL